MDLAVRYEHHADPSVAAYVVARGYDCSMGSNSELCRQLSRAVHQWHSGAPYWDGVSASFLLSGRCGRMYYGDLAAGT